VNDRFEKQYTKCVKTVLNVPVACKEATGIQNVWNLKCILFCNQKYLK